MESLDYKNGFTEVGLQFESLPPYEKGGQAIEVNEKTEIFLRGKKTRSLQRDVSRAPHENYVAAGRRNPQAREARVLPGMGRLRRWATFFSTL